MPRLAEDRPTMVLLHGSASHSGMWKALRSDVDSCFRTIAPDLIGYGRGPVWSPARGVRLEDEVDMLRQELAPESRPVHMVGYSYGGAVALAMACAHPRRIASLTLIEPVVFPALKLAGDMAAYAQFEEWHRHFLARSETSARDAMREFINAWSGDRAWESLPLQRRLEMEALTARIAWDWRASFEARPTREAFHRLGPATLLVRGDGSPAPMHSLVRSLHGLMTRSRLVVIPGANHLLPLTHSPQLAAALRAAWLHVD